MKFLCILILLVILTCETKKTDGLKISQSHEVKDSVLATSLNLFVSVKNKFIVNDQDIKWRIFDKYISDTLRIYRNRIYAKYGYKFKSEGLQDYFNSQLWYKINPKYSHSLLTRKDSISITTIKNYEIFKTKLDSNDTEELRRLFSFRSQLLLSGYDSLITRIGDITGDGIIDTLLTKISFEKDTFFIENILKNKEWVLWSNKQSIQPCIGFIDENDYILRNYPKFGYYYFVYEEKFRLLVPNVYTISELYGGSNYIKIETKGKDTTYIAGRIIFDYIKESVNLKKYLYKFNGKQVLFPDVYCLNDFSGGYTVKIWNRLTNDFIDVWSGP